MKIGRDIGRTIKYANNGMETRAGDTLISAEQMGYIDLAWQSIGFSPTKVADVYRRRDIDYQSKTPIQQERDNIFVRYKRAKTPQDRREADRLRREFNRKYPDFRITNSGLRLSLKSQRENEREFERTGGVAREQRAIFEKVRAIEGEPE
jgi:hypothetical protein